MGKRKVIWLLTIGVLLSILLYAQPYFAMYRLVHAAREGDDLVLQEVVDFPSVRDHLKARFAQQMMQEMESEKSNPFAALGVMLASKLSDSLIESLVTPEMLGSLGTSKEGDASKVSNHKAFERIWSQTEGHYATTSTFVLRPKAKAGEEAMPIRFIFQRDIIRFRLTRIDIDLRKAMAIGKGGQGKESKGKGSATTAETARPNTQVKAKATERPPLETRWVDFGSRSQIDDSQVTGVMLDATEEVYVRYGTVRPSMVIRCKAPKLDLFVNTRQILESDFESHTSSVRLRHDERPATTAQWGVSTDREALFAPDPNSEVAQIQSTRKLLIEFSPLSASPRVATFRIPSNSEPLLKVLRACGVGGSANVPRIVPKGSAVTAPVISTESRQEIPSIVVPSSKAEDPSKQDRLVEDYVARIRSRIQSRVVVPSDFEGNSAAVFEIVLLPGGEVLSATLRQSSGDRNYDAAVERAIMASQPFPTPDDPDLFQERFRELSLVFRPRD